ncbi:hypothetical protein KJ810_01980 [Patescibacteria group bacterium]|nr:hypothetical protein [Patescibacteria group bacterium]
MKKNLFSVGIITVVGLLVTTGVIFAASRINVTSTLGGVTGDYFDLDGTLTVQSMKVGDQGTGGVTFFNGTIVNQTTTEAGADNPVAFGDNVRIDGTIFRGATEGPGDDYPVKLNDDVRVFGDLTIDSGGTLNLTGVAITGISSDDLSDIATLPMLDEAETITGDWVNIAYPWAASEIADIVRQVNIPLTGMYSDADGTPAAITTVSTPAVAYTANQGLALVYAEDDTTDFGGQFTVPSDYTSGGVIKALVDTSGAIVNDWNLDFKVAISSAAWDTDMDNETPIDVPNNAGTPDVITFTPTDQADLTGGAVVNFSVWPDTNTATGEPNVEIYGVWFEYTAIQ